MRGATADHDQTPGILSSLRTGAIRFGPGLHDQSGSLFN